jgi:hypothetical protein
MTATTSRRTTAVPAFTALELTLLDYFESTTDTPDLVVLASSSRRAAALTVRALECRELLEPEVSFTSLERTLVRYFDATEALIRRKLIKGCRCGCAYTAEEWAARPVRYTRTDEIDGAVEARDCVCGSTLEHASARTR